jgi:hypothetical protein
VPELFETIGLLATAGGGLLAAFSARRPSRLVLWLVAYLVLVEGLVQFGLACGWQRLHLLAVVSVAAFVLYNLGNGAIIAGRVLKGRTRYDSSLVNLGGALLAVSMLLLVWAVHRVAASWTLAWFLALVLTILISMPVGLTLSAHRKSS